MAAPVKHALTFLCLLPAVGVTACASTVSTTSFKGESHEVAQAVSRLQSDVTAGDAQKVCAEDLASSVVMRLRSARGGCGQALKGQLAEIDNFEVTVNSIRVNGSTATATVKSVNAGKSHLSTVFLVRETGKWRVSGEG